MNEVGNKRIVSLDFSPIIGHESHKETITQAINFRYCNFDRYMEYIKSIGSKAAYGFLLAGISGTGKTMFLDCINESFKNNSDVKVVIVSSSDFMDHKIGASSKKIAAKFEEIRQIKADMIILLMDEIDGLVESRLKGKTYATERVDEFIKQVDGMFDNTKIMIIGTTNYLYNIDSAVVDRFETLEFNPPSEEQRVLLVQKYFNIIKFNPEKTHSEIAKMTDGFTGRMFKNISLKLVGRQIATDKPVDFLYLMDECNKYRGTIARSRGD